MTSETAAMTLEDVEFLVGKARAAANGDFRTFTQVFGAFTRLQLVWLLSRAAGRDTPENLFEILDRAAGSVGQPNITSANSLADLRKQADQLATLRDEFRRWEDELNGTELAGARSFLQVLYIKTSNLVAILESGIDRIKNEPIAQ